MALEINEQKLRDLYLRKLALGEIQGPPTCKPSIDKPWLKYYSEDDICSENFIGLSIYEFLKEKNKNNLEKNAITFINKTITYKEFFSIVDKVAIALSNVGVKAGEVICVDIPAMPEENFLLYAIDKIGAAVTFCFPNTPDDKLIKYINEFKCKKIFLFSMFENNVKKLIEKTNLDTIVIIGEDLNEKYNDNESVLFWNEFLKKGNKKQDVDYKRNSRDLLFVAKTGGSTGEPKSVCLNDEGFNIVVNQYLNSGLDYNTGDKWLRIWPIFSATAAVSSNHAPLCAGMELIIEPLNNINDLDKIIIKHKPNHIPLVPSFLDSLINSKIIGNSYMPYFKTIGCGGGKMTENFEKKAKEFFEKHNISTFLGCGYGLTENSSTATIRMSHETAKENSVGVPMVKTNVGIFEVGTDKEMLIGETGEICINSNSIMLGYFDNPILTNSIIKTHSDSSRWIHTGDVGYIDKDGLLYVIDRLSSVIFLYSADKAYPSEINNFVLGIEGVKDVATVAEPDAEHEDFFVPACCIVVKEGYDSLTVIDSIKKACKNGLIEYSIPRDIYVMDHLPLNDMGKTDIKKLEKEIKKLYYNNSV